MDQLERSMTRPLAECNPQNLSIGLNNFSSQRRVLVARNWLSRAPYLEDQLLVSETLRYLLEKDEEKARVFDVLPDVNAGEMGDEDTHGRLPLEGIKAIEGNIQKRAEAVLEMSLIGCIQPDEIGYGSDVKNESLCDKLKWVEDTIRLQQLDLEKKRHQIFIMRQDLIKGYENYFEIFYKSMGVMIELLTDATSNKEFQRFRVFETYMASLAESLTMKLSVLDATIRVNTYDHDTVRALQVIRSSLETQHSEIKQRKEEIETKIEAYNSQGSDFTEIAKAYTQVIAKIKDTKDHIARINSTYA
ncbi:unnamed protein product [Umbelopsis vinacea]